MMDEKNSEITILIQFNSVSVAVYEFSFFLVTKTISTFAENVSNIT